jgi:large subunit ribosomal protein L22
MATTAAAQQEYRAEARFQRVSPQKARLVLDLIRGQRVEQALLTVAFTRKRIAPVVEKVLRSAIDNAHYLAQERGDDVDVDRLYVKQAIVNEGPRMKRIRPAPQGRAFHYQRRMSHIIISVAEKKSATTVTRVEEHGTPEAAAGKPAKKAAKKFSFKRAAKKAPAKKHIAAKKTTKKKSAK